jgi:hypothetical protein
MLVQCASVSAVTGAITNTTYTRVYVFVQTYAQTSHALHRTSATQQAPATLLLAPAATLTKRMAWPAAMATSALRATSALPASVWQAPTSAAAQTRRAATAPVLAIAAKTLLLFRHSLACQ